MLKNKKFLLIDNLKNDNTDIDINENRDNAIEINQYEEKKQ